MWKARTREGGFCPKLSNKSGHKGKKESNSKKAYVAWDDNGVSSSSDSERDETANLALTTSHDSYDDEE